MAAFNTLCLVALCACAVSAQFEERAPRYIASEPKVTSTPVPILKQINRHNEDGSYTYGYEAADGSFKIETKSPTGEVKGKYGYKDDTGKVRVVEYGANKFGFQPAGEGITVAPPTLVDESAKEDQRSTKTQGGRSQYRAPAPQSVDYDYEEPAPAPAPRPAPRAPPQYRPAPAAPAPPKPSFFAGASPAPAAAPAPISRETFFRPEPPRHYQPREPPQQQYSQEYDDGQNYNQQQNFGSPGFSQSFAAQPSFSQGQNSFSQGQNSFSQGQNRFSQGQNSLSQGQRQPSYNLVPQQRSAPFSMLDQLLKEYALPPNGAAPLHDITFGTY